MRWIGGFVDGGDGEDSDASEAGSGLEEREFPRTFVERAAEEDVGIRVSGQQKFQDAGAGQLELTGSANET